ncbi:MAG: putative dual-specificity RNA methyltransferase RlmN [candidate division WS6 bacterium OLB20]|uniref:Probable dual-specificity RNA methyltransferase RlmN n=1 Tax=candidate division WS6 bacterium OLB20 TaxID=1617426 RepID=A0A136LXU8_9BACT|nr:MAG: putative dual-specificity RNA methyltransferase RlmN [candidate division WS6 bacterium OLB20]
MITAFAKKYDLPSFRTRQFNEQFYKHGIPGWDSLTTWPAELRAKLAEEVRFMTLEFELELISKNGDTEKVLLKREDGQRIEAVLMRHKDGRNTVCVSCMVGCPVNCSFCATGKMGFGGNLSAREIIDQVMYFQRKLVLESERVSNVVFMGMGEPMLNLKNVMEAIDILSDPDKLALGARRITVSTSGYVPQFRQLMDSGFRGRVAISLHAPNQEVRARLMPVAKLFPLDQLMATLDDYTALTNKRISYEYVMIRNVNDRDEHARDLAKLLRGRLAHVNLIPYNPIREMPFKRSERDQIRRFTDILERAGVNVTVRVTMGDDVDAACGQLADRANKANRDKKIRI